MRQLHWLESKQLDRVTNYSTEIEVLKAGIKRDINVKYYCTFAKNKEYFGLKSNINYLGFFKNRYVKALEFPVRVIFKAMQLVITFDNVVIMVNQDLTKNVLPAYFLNKWLGKKNKFLVDIRTTPTNPATFEEDMDNFHNKFNIAAKYFDGFSFITPFMEKYVMKNYNVNTSTVNWSSGVDTELFNSKLYSRKNHASVFTIFYHGGISISRGNLNLIKACELLISNGYKVDLVQIGICVDKQIEGYIYENKLESWCKLLPPVPLDEIPQHIANSDLPVLPFPNFVAWRVSSPIKLMEYLAMGKKVLAPSMEAFTNVFENRPELIFYYNTKADDQIQEISNKIAYIIDNKLVQKVEQKKCVDFVQSKITWEKQANKLLDFAQAL